MIFSVDRVKHWLYIGLRGLGLGLVLYNDWPREDPAFLDVHHGKEWDGEGADDEVRHRQGEEEVVGDCL